MLGIVGARSMAAGISISDSDGQHFAARLRKYRRSIAGVRNGITEGDLSQTQGDNLGELSTYDNHPADLGTESYIRGRQVGMAQDLDRELARCDDALDRLRQGTYGICQRCGALINHQRLLAIPSTPFCLSCSNAVAAEGGDQRRPIEEQVIGPPFGRTFRDNTGDVEFDGEDSWQAVARYGTSNTPSDVPGTEYPEVVADEFESRGTVEETDKIKEGSEDALDGGSGLAARASETLGGAQSNMWPRP